MSKEEKKTGVKGIIVTIGGKDITLTEKETRELYESLKRLLHDYNWYYIPYYPTINVPSVWSPYDVQPSTITTTSEYGEWTSDKDGPVLNNKCNCKK